MFQTAYVNVSALVRGPTSCSFLLTDCVLLLFFLKMNDLNKEEKKKKKKKMMMMGKLLIDCSGLDALYVICLVYVFLLKTIYE